MRIFRAAPCFVALAVCASGLAGQRSPVPDPAGRVPEGLSSTDWSGIRKAHAASRHAAFAVDGRYQARNPEQQWLTRFDGRGFSVQPDAGGWTWGLDLERYGFARHQCTVTEPTPVKAAGARVAYDWNASLQEWYVNGPSGLEHGYTLNERPPRDQDEEGSLTFTLAVRGELAPRIDGDHRDVSFVDRDGAPMLTYAGLRVSDADGEALMAHFDAVGEGLLLTIDERGARYPLTIDPIVQEVYLKASNSSADDQFGSSVAVEGNTIAIGAYLEDSNAMGVNGNQNNEDMQNSGAVYVFVRNGGTWSQQAYLKASNPNEDDNFGGRVALSGDTLVICAVGEDSNATGVNGNQGDNSATNAGAAYVFVRSGTTWSQQAYLKPSNTGAGDNFIAASISGDTIVIGAPRESSNATGVNGNQSDNSATEAGAAYVFVRSGSTWSQQAYLKASNTESADFFGTSVSVSGDTVAVSAANYVRGEDSSATGVNGDQSDNSALSAGAVYVFVRSGATWTQQAYVKASNTGADDNFGLSLSLSGNTLLVGAWSEDCNSVGINGNQANNFASDSGAAYVFVRSGTTWSQQAYLKASNTGVLDGFGWSVALSGDTAVIGARGEDSGATGVNGNQSDNSALGDTGAAYAFERSGTTWNQVAYIKASNTQVNDLFGVTVAVSGDIVVIGAPDEDSQASGVNGNQGSNAAASAGAAYAFNLYTDSTDIDLTTGTSGTFSHHNYDGTRGVDVTVVAPQSLNVTALTLSGLAVPVFVGADVTARIYRSSNGATVASSATVTVFDDDLTIPITAILEPGVTYRICCYVTTPGFSNSSANMFDPAPSGAAGFPYDESLGWLEIGGAFGTTFDTDTFPITASQYVPEITVSGILGDLNWTDLGSAKAGISGNPALAGAGTLSAGSSNQLALTNAKTSATAALFFGLSQVNAPFKGGVLVPSPLLTISLVTNASGNVTLPFVLPAGLPPAFPLFFQFWIQDSGAALGLSASNGLKGVTS